MQIQSINNTYSYGYNYNSRPSFKGAAVTRTCNHAHKGLTELKHIFAGTYGTYIEGSKPLTDFFSRLSPDVKDALIKKGLSTNIECVANCFLKSKWDNPISTSGVFDCSVMYLANENTRTHFLYHMYKDVDYENIQKVIKQFMPESFTRAAIVPGDKIRIQDHKKYLHEVFKAIRDSNPEAEIDAYHYSSKLPEIVGYMGEMFEIPRESLESQGQNSFKIQNIHYYDNDLYLADIYSTPSALRTVSELIAAKDMDEEAQKAIQKYIQDKINSVTPKSKLIEFFTKIKDNLRLLSEQFKLIKNSLF